MFCHRDVTRKQMRMYDICYLVLCIVCFQIPSYDTNSHCLCVAGEVYCWWQNYNPSTAPSLGPSSLQSTTAESNYTPSLEASTDVADGFEASGDAAAESPIGQQQGHVEMNATSTTATPSAPATCLVMGISNFSHLLICVSFNIFDRAESFTRRGECSIIAASSASHVPRYYQSWEVTRYL